MINPLDLIFHIDTVLGPIIQQFGAVTYLLLFLIIFCETGLVFLPFLPGDSLLFVAGTFASIGSLNIMLLFVALSLAAVIGDSVNYFMGKFFGEKVFLKRKLLEREHYENAKAYFEKHGGKTIIIARFIPIIRTVAPFVAGVGKMDYPSFLGYNVIGGVAWVGFFLFAGNFFGNVPVVKQNLSLFIMGIILVSLLPAVIGYANHAIKKKKR